jgi:hypothetical protein
MRERQHFLDLRRVVLCEGDLLGGENNCDAQPQSIC